MTPAAVPIEYLGDLQQSLREAEALHDAVAYAAHVSEAVQNSGAGASKHLKAIAAGGANLENAPQAIADCVHFLTILHGQAPSLFDIARSGESGVPRSWLDSLAEQFEHDRRWLSRLNVVTGTFVDRQGLSPAEQVVRDQREAMLTLARSSRKGCALGAAVALAHDWDVIRIALSDALASLKSDHVSPPAGQWLVSGNIHVLREAGEAPALRRAVGFGATQLASLHRQFFDLLDARHALRSS